MAGKGTMIQFGKITVMSDSASLADVQQALNQILHDHGYPEISEEGDEPIQEKTKAELEKEVETLLEDDALDEQKPVEEGQPWLKRLQQ